MNILVVGNGFDVWHGLPTKYTDFLDFLQVLKAHAEGSGNPAVLAEAIEESILCQKYRPIRLFFQTFGDNKLIVAELLELVIHNCWIEYFLTKTLAQDRWIDFEKEISNVIQDLEDGHDPKIFRNCFFSSLSDRSFDERSRYTPYSAAIWSEKMLADLNRSIRCFEIYLSLCARTIPIDKKLNCLSRIGKIDKVLSFNYTGTISRIYPDLVTDTEYCYIHGKASLDSTVESNNMVLGIDEYLDPDKRSSHTDYIRFKKYYQRIFKQTDYNYTDWLKEKALGEEKNIHIIGHSLDLTDLDVLRDLILQENYNYGQYYETPDKINTTIYYRDKNSNARQIEKLVQLLGYDNLNALARGSDPHRSIRFLPLE